MHFFKFFEVRKQFCETNFMFFQFKFKPSNFWEGRKEESNRIVLILPKMLFWYLEIVDELPSTISLLTLYYEDQQKVLD